MKKKLVTAILLMFCFQSGLNAEVLVEKSNNHQELLSSNNKGLENNKKLVYDFWREVLEGGHIDKAEQYLTKSYIQHNPNVPTGRAGFVNFFSKLRKPKTIEEKIKAPLVSIVAEGDLVVFSFVYTKKEDDDDNKKYTTTWFDMFRIENGKIAEHWDSALKDE